MSPGFLEYHAMKMDRPVTMNDRRNFFIEGILLILVTGGPIVQIAISLFVVVWIIYLVKFVEAL
jgi:hypothetical protein